MSVDERDNNILKHIIDYCEQIRATVERFGDDFEIFDQDVIYRNAVSLCLLQIGELVGVLSDEFKKAHSDIPWVQIKHMRNIVAHRYGTVDATITWDVIKDDIPELQSYCADLYEEKE